MRVWCGTDVQLILQLAAIRNDARGLGAVPGALGGALNGLDDVHALEHLAKHDVLAIQVRRGNLRGVKHATHKKQNENLA